MGWDAGVSFLDHLMTVLDFSAFDAVWYWVLLALLWSHWTQTTLGAPLAMIRRAQMGDKAALADLAQLCDIHARDLRGLTAQLGAVMVTGVGVILGFLAALGFVYQSPLAQSVFFLVMPAVGVGYFRSRLAQRWPMVAPQDQVATLLRHRRRVQLFGACLIFFTAIWGVFFLQQIPLSPL